MRSTTASTSWRARWPRSRRPRRAAKEALNAAGDGPATGLALERRAWAGLFGTRDQREGMEAFSEKRDPESE